MEGKEISNTDFLKGVFDNESYDLFCIKNADYTMKLMPTYGTMKLMPTYGSLLSRPEVPDKHCHLVDGTRKFCKYMGPLKNHFLYQHHIDDHNNKQHSKCLWKKLG